MEPLTDQEVKAIIGDQFLLILQLRKSLSQAMDRIRQLEETLKKKTE